MANPRGICVHKYGGTSVGSVERLKAVAARVAACHREGRQMVVVVSAMKDTTDDLLKLAGSISRHPPRREIDMLLTAGERISMALLSLAIWEEGVSAISFTGSQSGIITDTWHSHARIIEIRAVRIIQELAAGKVVIVAGFQGVSPLREITTLGRGGSDTTAVALSAALKARQCHIYTDVDGMFSADPRIVPAAHLLPKLDYDSALAMAYTGASVIHPRAVELARRYNVPLEIRNSFYDRAGTLLGPLKESPMENPNVTAVNRLENTAVFRIALPARPAALGQDLLAALHERQIEPASVQLEPGALAFLVALSDEESVRSVLNEKGIGEKAIRMTSGTLISLVGDHLAQDAGMLAAVSRLCRQSRIGLPHLWQQFNTILLLVSAADGEKAVRLLHRDLVEKPVYP